MNGIWGDILFVRGGRLCAGGFEVCVIVECERGVVKDGFGVVKGVDEVLLSPRKGEGEVNEVGTSGKTAAVKAQEMVGREPHVLHGAGVVEYVISCCDDGFALLGVEFVMIGV